ncbi:MAG: glycoside hydrolase family 28 protein [Turicibacter sp.]|nr:glycoside hydrolase family 28 protein [Turicibacter sp.]
MKCKPILITSTSATFELENEAVYRLVETYDVLLNGELVLTGISKNVFSLYNLTPHRNYDITLRGTDGKSPTVSFETKSETMCLNVRRFGAVGDGVADDTQAIQAAIMSCCENGRVLIPAGTYHVKTIFLKSNFTLELAKGATLSYQGAFHQGAILPGYTFDAQGEEYYLGSWEGNPIDSYTALIQGINVENVNLIGEGVLDGNGHNWWGYPKVRKGAWRPRLVQLIHSKRVNLQGLTVRNSPSWTIHPLFSSDLIFADLTIINPKDSPNTDGLNPESCHHVLIVGVYFSVGDDCIAIKSGKIYLGRKLKRPSRRITIRNCSMNFGHGAVVVGSEMAGGVKDVTVSQCLFNETDRGLRIKTRRGRGKDAIVDGIYFKNIQMHRVQTPLVINKFYFCDPDGHSDYVRTKEALPVDERTPYIGKLVFEDIASEASSVAAGFFYGLPEQPISELVLKNCSFSMVSDGEADYPAMMDDISKYAQAGLIFHHVKSLVMNNVTLDGVVGEKVVLNDVDKVVMEDDH